MAIRFNEESAGNTLHAGLILFSVGLLVFKPFPERKIALLYSLLVALTLILFSTIFKWQIYGSRLQLPFFILFSPAIGFLIEKIFRKRLLPFAGLALVVCAWPWLFSINSRPIIPTTQSKIGSIFTTSRLDLLFANAAYQKRSYQNLAVYQSDCNGLAFH
jgi:hypothetical protein